MPLPGPPNCPSESGSAYGRSCAYLLLVLPSMPETAAARYAYPRTQRPNSLQRYKITSALGTYGLAYRAIGSAEGA